MSKYDIVRQPGGGIMIQISTEDFSWDYTFPNGKHKRGVAASLEDAESKIEAIHYDFIVDAWARGNAHSRRQWACPLT